MKTHKKEWHYVDAEKGQWIGPVTIEQLDELYRKGKIEDFTQVINTQMAQNEGPMAQQGISYSMISRLNVEFTPSVEEFHKSRENNLTTVLSGPNNCGKTLLLKQLFSHIGQGGYMVGCNRFSHVDVLNTRQIDEHEHRRYYDNFMQNFYTSRQNTENNELQLERVITGLKNEQREKLFDICRELIGNTFSLKQSDPENQFSPYYIDVDGENLRYSSTGTRLLLTLFGTLLDTHFTSLLIDEPEIGLSPRIQVSLANFLYNEDRRRSLFPHLQQLYVVTHSHFFLDRRVFSNNFVVAKSGDAVEVKPVRSIGDFHQLQFALLGNEFESLFLPSAIVIVEGGSDVIFMAKIMQLHIPSRKIAIVRAGGDGGVQDKLNVLKEAFGDLMTNPYRDRFFIVLDQKHSLKKERIQNQGVQGDNISVWSKNGIEYIYPPELIEAAFCCSREEASEIDLENDPIEFNEIKKSKKDLAQFVADRLTTDQSLNAELKDLVTKIRTACR